MLTRREFAASAAVALPAQRSDDSRGPSPPWRRALTGNLTVEQVAAALQPRTQFAHFPTLGDRRTWDGLSPDIRAALIAAGEARLGQPWAALPATLFLEYRRNGNRSRYEAARTERRRRLNDLLFAELAENKGRFLDELVNGIWLTCEETYWGVPAHVGVQKAGTGLPDAEEPTVDLFAADTAATLSWTNYLLGETLDKVSPLVRRRIAHEVKAKVLAPCFTRNDFWWMGLEANRPMNNWNPWICSNWLTAALLMETDEPRRAATVHKILRCLDRFLDSYHDDGGCDEGPGYWGHAGASLFECLELVSAATAGKLDFFHLPLVAEMGRYIYRAHIADDWYVNFADASARISAYGELIYRYGKRIKDAPMMAHGAYVASLKSNARISTGSVARTLDALLVSAEIARADRKPPLVRDVWLSGTHVFVTRTRGGTAEGLYVAAQGGHNAESHNHNDVGNFLVFVGGRPALIDVGVETYTAKTFSGQRYEIWTMQSAYHNLPTVNGVMQGAGRRFEAAECRHAADDAAAEFSLDIARAYPGEAGIEKWRRTFRLDRRANRLEVADEAAFKKAGNRVEFNLMTPCSVKIVSPGRAELSGGLIGQQRVLLEFPASLQSTVDEIKISDARLGPVWGKVLYRIRLLAEGVPASARWRLQVAQL